MPNGDPDFDFEDMERFFAPIAEAVHKFAIKRNLYLDKYYHDGRDWSLRFNHPKGGQASIFLRRDAENRLLVSSSWHFDDYDKSTRFFHNRDEQQCQLDARVVLCMLEDELRAIVAVEFGMWHEASPAGWERLLTKEEFANATPKYPHPNLAGLDSTAVT